MATSNGAVDKTAEKTGTEKVSEKLAEKRRALGRGLESLLPGPRVVPASPTLPQSTRKDGAPASSSLSSSSSSSSGFSSGAEGGRGGGGGGGGGPRRSGVFRRCGGRDSGRVAGGRFGADCGWGDDFSSGS